ncbi:MULTISPECIES: universal stress protein [Kitasatospora]|uniref:Universal stress protein n=1 Tax=Kitasatospora cathayae TaxID=3004092 RepID=A0ABY7Q0V1_9ACTN|nr:universal stress protein [Kitasatospora sp. HUAS 3-15]WBP86305.1 universal stress protein [Kitasatospora sp. HUAS 3-15]
MTEQNEPQHRIVVGVDGSPSSIDALRWAVDQARTRGAVIEALTAWQYPVSTGWTVPIQADEDLATLMSKVLDDAIAQVAGPECPVAIRPRVLEGGAVSCLLDAARGADLLVVGSRGHGGFVGALLGSVSGHCVQHAPCPVVVVRHTAV